MRFRIQSALLTALFPCFLCCLTAAIYAQQSGSADMLLGNYDIVVKDCRTQIQETKFDQCLDALRRLAARVPGDATEAEAEVKARVGYFMPVVEAYKAAGELNPEQSSNYYNPILKAYAAIPEKYFPYDDVVPLWNLYLREETGRTRFNRFRGLKVMVRSGEEDKTLQESFSQLLEPHVLAFGYSILDPTSSLSSNPDTLLKVDLKGSIAQDSTDPRLQYKKIYRLTMDVTTFKFLSARAKVEPMQVEIEVPANAEAVARDQAIEQGTVRLTHLLFYHNLRTMFSPTASSN